MDKVDGVRAVCVAIFARVGRVLVRVGPRSGDSDSLSSKLDTLVEGDLYAAESELKLYIESPLSFLTPKPELRPEAVDIMFSRYR